VYTHPPCPCHCRRCGPRTVLGRLMAQSFKVAESIERAARKDGSEKS
jgi:hypothetical protein